MAPQKPVVLCDNVFDRIQLYPRATLVSSGETTGREARRVADYRRDETSWMPPSAGEIPHLYLNGTAGGSGGAWCKGTPGTFAPPGTSRTVGLAFRSSAGFIGGQIQAFADFQGGTTLTFLRSDTNGKIGFYDGAFHNFGIAAPTDDAWHTFVWTEDGAGSVCNFYLDGVQTGNANMAYTPTALSTSTQWALWAGIGSSQNLNGRAGVFAYYGSVLSQADIMALHAALLGGGVFPAGLVAKWDPAIGQGTQTLTDTVGGANVTLGATPSVEWSPQQDPFWGGGHWVGVSLDAATGTIAPTFLYIDRGHNLWGRYVIVEGTQAPDFSRDTFTDRSMAAIQVPALDSHGSYVVGGDPTTGFCVTEEGALWTFVKPVTGPLVTASSNWRVRVFSASNSFTPVIPGILLGAHRQLATYPQSYDEDAGGRTSLTAVSRTGYQAMDTTYSWRTLRLDLALIGNSDYDAGLRTLRDTLWAKRQPAVVIPDYGTHPERAWLYVSDSDTWAFDRERAYRSGQIALREWRPKLG